MFNFSTILGIVQNAPKIIASAPAFKQLFDQVLTVFKPGEQAQLKDAYAKAIAESDAAQEDFTKAGRGD